MESPVIVFIFLKGKWMPAGRLKYFSRGRQSYSVFAYGKKYLEEPEAVSLDPVQIPLSSGEFQSPEGFDIFNGIRDAGADQWGRYLIDKRFTNTDELDYILATSHDRVGALAFGDDPNQGPKSFSPKGFETLGQKRFDLGKAANAIQGTIAGKDSEELKEFLIYGPSLGGTRPKTTVNWQGKPYIAKFSVSYDRRNEPLIEYATMSLAKKCGLKVPALDKARVMGRDVFLIQRFDRRVTQLPNCPNAIKKIKKNYSNGWFSTSSYTTTMITTETMAFFTLENRSGNSRLYMMSYPQLW
jgi:serine/threonine-protein kinase HipA